MTKSKQSIFKWGNITSLMQGRIPSQLIIQYTDYCNGACPQCSMRKTESFKRTKLPKDELYRIIEAAAQQNVQSLSFTGGEPFLYKDELMDLIQYASNQGIPLIRTGTNGFMFQDWESPDFEDKIHRLAEKLASTNLRNLWISIDSADAATHEQMRGLKGVIKGIEKALPIFHEHGIFPAANLGINRNTGGAGNIALQMRDEEEFYLQFKKAFEMFYIFVMDLGFTMANTCYPMSLEDNEGSNVNVYGAASSSQIVSFSKQEKVQIFKALLTTIPEFRGKLRIFTPLVSLYSLIKQYKGDVDFALPCRGGIDFFFVDAQGGDTYPCGYRGQDNLGKFYNLDVKSLKQKPFCKACDWECFRDPSEQIGFLIEALHNPFSVLKTKDVEYRRLWKEDIQYYRQSNYFDGRQGPA